MATLLLATASLFANPAVTTLGGGNPNVSPKYLGDKDGVTLSQALFHTPCGIALDGTGQFLFLADRDNSAIRYLDLEAGQTWTFEVTYTNLISKPIAVAVDMSDYVYVLNRGNGTNGSVVTFDGYLLSATYGEAVATNAVKLTNAAGMALDTVGNIYVTVQSNKLIRIAAGTTNRTVVATNFPAGTSLQGIVVKHNGLIAACDSGRNGIYLIDPATGIVTTNAGFHGTGDFTTNGNNIASSLTAKFNQPMCVVETGDGTLIVSDYGNNRVKAVLTSGVVTNLYGVTSKYWGGTYPGWYDGTVYVPDSTSPNVQSRLPFGIAEASDGSFYTTEDYYHTVRHCAANLTPPVPPAPSAPTGLMATTNYGQVTLTWNASSGATSYNIKRSLTSGGPYTTIGTSTTTSFTDTTVLNGVTYYYVVSAVNSGGESPNSAEVSTTPPVPAPPAPRIGWYDYEYNGAIFVTVLHPVSTYVANNDVYIAIDPVENGVSTYYIAGPTPLAGTPSVTNGTTPPFYEDGYAGDVIPLPVTTVSNLTIKAVNVNPGTNGLSSPIAIAQFIFQVGNPTISGNNAAQFTLSDITSNVVYWYTIDGSDPTNSAIPPSTSIGPIVTTNGNPVTLSLNGSTNILFKVRAYRTGYQPSGIAIQTFVTGAFVPNSISFGFASGEASSDFVASPGQTFYAPVTLSPLSGTTIYSLQFNLTVTNAGPNPGPALTPGAIDFVTMLMKPNPDEQGFYLPIPPFMFLGTNGNNSFVTNTVYYAGSSNWVSLLVTNASANLLGVGWVERYSETNLYNTLQQDLIQYSIAHDNLFVQSGGQVILGGYNFLVPSNAQPGQTYQIQIGRPTATSDGVGTPGSSVFIFAPTNGSMAGGTINAIKNVTIGQRAYLVGNVYPFRWFNAGDFGNTNLQNADVEQVFEAAVYGLNNPPYGSDFYDAMDSCGATYVDLGHGYLELNTAVTDIGALNTLLNGNDSTINQIAFGDGVLDVCDVYVTYRRSLDPTLNWFERFWTNGVRVAEIVPNTFNQNVAVSALATAKASSLANNVSTSFSVTNEPLVVFTAGDCQTNAGSTIQIPITANILGNYPLRVLMLNLSVVAIDGSPALTTPISFSYNPALGSPWTTEQRGNDNYSAVWLNSGIAGLSNNVTIGILTVTIPTNATSSSAYAVHFNHISASPNGLGTFPKQVTPGLITFSSRTNSSWGDAIPDSWRLRYFLTLNNVLSATNADADGDGQNNLQEYYAGTDPTDPTSVFKNIGTDQAAAQQPSDCVISWPSVIGKQYVILRASSMTSLNWTAIATNNGTGNIMEYHDTTGGGVRYYRVRVQ